MTEQKLGFVILVHEDLAQLARLLAALGSSPFIVHVDKASRLDITTVKKMVEAGEGKIATRRFRTYWASFNVVRAMITSAEELVMCDGNIGKVAYISGTCFPLSSTERIETVLMASPEKIFANRFILPENGTGMMSMARIRSRHWFGGPIGWIRSHLSYSVGEVFRRVAHALSPKRRSLPEYRYTCGSQWMAIPRELVLEIAQAYRLGWFRPFQNSFAPDETAIQTYISSTGWRNYADPEMKDIPEIVSGTANFHWLKASLRGYLTEGEVGEALASQKLFARKISVSKDAAASDLAVRGSAI